MNTRINKTLSVLAVLGIVASSFVWAMPVAAANPGDEKWAEVNVPSTTDNVILPGSQINDIAVGTDGKTMYVVDKNNDAAMKIFKSTDGGKTFDDITNDYGGGDPKSIAVAPDDINQVAVTDGSNVWFTRDGGTSWRNLAFPTDANSTITGIVVSGARSSTTYGREYFVSVADTRAGNVTGNLMSIGINGTWEDVLTSLKGTADFTSIALSPNYVSDRSIVAVGTSNTAGSTSVYVINTSGVASVVKQVQLLTGGNTADVGAASNDIIYSSIALPSDYDPAGTTQNRAYIGITTNSTTDDTLFRYTNNSSKAIGSDLGLIKVKSVAYAGTATSGKLFVGQVDSGEINWTDNPTATDPTWADNPPEVSGGIGTNWAAARVDFNTVVRTASDFATTNKIFAGTSGNEAALSVSDDAGVSFYGQTLVNIGTGTNSENLPKPSLSFTGNTTFLSSTDDLKVFNIWRTDATPWTSTGWKRIYAKGGTSGAGFSLSLNPAFSTTPAMYIFETTVNNGKIYVSQDAGVTWTNRNFPATAARGSSALRDANTVYFLTTGGDLYKSTNAAYGWGDKVATGLNSGTNITLPAANEVIASGNSVAISTDDGETFNMINNGLDDVGTDPTKGSYKVAKDGAYATNHLIYAVDTKAASNQIYRVDASNTDNTWDSMDTSFGAAVVDISVSSGVLYATTNVKGVGVERTLFPADTIGKQYWSSLNKDLGVDPTGGVTATSGINLYLKPDSGKILAYKDYLATTKPTITDPADNYADAVDPASGYGYFIDLKFQPMASGSTKVNKVDLEIVDKTLGLTGAPTYTNQVIVAPDNPYLSTGSLTSPVFNLQPNHSYVWRIRAAGTTAETAVISQWSDVRTINVQAGGQVVQQQAGVILQGPQPGAMGVNPNLVGFSWAPVPGATEYQIIVATDAALTKTVAGTPAKVTTTSYQATGLTAGTTYFWAVQATQPTTSQQSVGTFTTASATGTGNQTGGGTQPTITVVVPPTTTETPAYIWAVIAIGAILIIAVIILIVRTRRVP